MPFRERAETISENLEDNEVKYHSSSLEVWIAYSWFSILGQGKRLNNL